MELTAKAQNQYYSMPAHISDEVEKVIISSKNVLFPVKKPQKKDEKSKNKYPIAYVLIGFDTEYQTHEPVTREELKDGVKNDLLSYQFVVRVISAEHSNVAGKAFETEGIIIPRDDKRLLLEDFLAIALGAYVKKNPKAVIPTDIILIGHFLRADFPAFADFRSNAKGFAANVRSTYVSLNNSLNLKIKMHKSKTVVTFRVRLRDTILLAPANAKSLAKIGEIIKEEKIILHEDPKIELHIKENMGKYLKDNWENFRKYAIQDARICVEYSENIIRQSQSLFNEFNMPVTLTSFGTKQVLKNWKEAGWNPLEVLGRYEFKERKYITNTRRMFTEITTPYISKVHFEESFITETYHGGRNEQYIFGPAKISDWRDLDLSSAYPTAMSLIGLPKWETLTKNVDIEKLEPTDLAYFEVAFEFPEHIRFPVLPVRTSNGIIFPKKGISNCATPELLLAKSLGAELTILWATKVESDKTKPIFKSFIVNCIQERRKFGKGEFGNFFWKEVGNSTYGKTAQGLRRKRVYDLRENNMVILDPSKLTQPFFASFITSFTRAVLGEILNSLPQNVTVFSVTTDGFLSNASESDIENAISLPLLSLFKRTRFELIGDDQVLEVKHVVKQPIGWRTRGSATLIEGDKVNDEIKTIVLQKGGIKTKNYESTKAENEEIINHFVNRTIESTLYYKRLIGLRDEMESGSDLVYVNVPKTLRMEFDWKRNPISAKDIDFTFKDNRYSHLGFNSIPLKDINEFIQFKEAFEKYNIEGDLLLKTKEDFEKFQVFVETQKLPKKAAKNISKKGEGDIDRLRRDLVTAFRYNLAGFDEVKIRFGKKITYQNFADILTAHGIKCKLYDVDNGRKQPFKANQVPSTPRALKLFNDLKMSVFHELEESVFF